MREYTVRPIARMESDFPEKFGIPRQAGIVEQLESRIIFEPEYRVWEAVRGIEGFSHLWLIWRFSECEREGFSPTVRPPRLGGNVRMGVFATRSPFRPNSLGLSCVRLLAVERDVQRGPVLRVAGADLMDGTPILDIKPYLPYTDCRTEAAGGFAEDKGYRLRVELCPQDAADIPEDKLAALTAVLENDPRPRYQQDPERVYVMDFAGLRVRFSVSCETLRVLSVDRI